MNNAANNAHNEFFTDLAGGLCRRFSFKHNKTTYVGICFTREVLGSVDWGIEIYIDRKHDEDGIEMYVGTIRGLPSSLANPRLAAKAYATWAALP